MILYLPRWLWASTILLVAFYWLNPSWKSDALYLTQAALTLTAVILFAKRRHWVLAAGLASTLFADLSYYLQVYRFKLDVNNLRFYLTTSFTYSIGFGLISLSLYNQVKRGTNLFRSFKISLLPILIIIGGTVSMLFEPMLAAFRQGTVQYHEIGTLTELSMSLPLIAVSYLAIMLSFELTDTCLAIGCLLMGFVDWAIQLEYVTSGKLAFSYLDSLWFFSILLIFSRSLDPRELRNYPSFEGKSLRVQLKILTLLCSLLPVGAYYSLNRGDLRIGIGFFLFGTAISLFVASIVVEYFSRQLMGLTNEIQQIFDSASRPLEIKPASGLSEEWGESLKIILRNKLRQDKLKADQERWLLEKRTEISAQVSHDIRSPLTALNVAISDTSGLCEQRRTLIKNAVARINDIANTLLQEKHDRAYSSQTAISWPSPESAKPQVILLSPLIDSVVSEKRMQFRDMQNVAIEAELVDAYGYFVSVDPVELKRAVSNLITNSVEALPLGRGRVVVTVEGSDQRVRVCVSDNGKGIPLSVLGRLGEAGFSYGKVGPTSGSGLGIHHAQKTVRSAGGTFEIRSAEGQGTSIEMTFKQAPTPAWFVERLVFKNGEVVCSVDDDLSIHEVWRARLESAQRGGVEPGLLAFTSLQDFEAWFGEHTRRNEEGFSAARGLFLFDHEFLGQKRTGLDVIEELGLGDRAVLVTSRYEERSIRERCDSLGVPLIPKPMAGFVPIVVRDANQ